jgi:hypothetical protein
MGHTSFWSVEMIICFMKHKYHEGNQTRNGNGTSLRNVLDEVSTADNGEGRGKIRFLIIITCEVS